MQSAATVKQMTARYSRNPEYQSNSRQQFHTHIRNYLIDPNYYVFIIHGLSFLQQWWKWKKKTF